ncbi:AAA family ATPase [Campylobacter jejuni]|uniref:AAA family ATPase n=1 Tax=Campylobacter TaxID=194 RepID=UPI0008748FD7|nr:MULTISPECIES: AAA family ATPase [Campylobacter]ECL6143848.1 AAA family ATPase [Campylobacter jejuni]ECO2639708.1 AAA family ATPase [Campylobacter jejuni]OEW18284.1 chromosome partitioning protein ParA [Campylobacter sp. BCW_6877]OEW47300.1 chromosome partitioning protein ParA [Campylobacter sp. BCW_6466]OEW94479.1 chromosome partitioning protein ParA [Campylobacter jejuni]
MIISIANEKGGSGKTTIATNLAFKLAFEGIDLMLVDADPQRSVETFIDYRVNNDLELPFSSMSKIGSSLSQEVIKLKEKYDSIIIDTGGRDSKEMRQAFVVSDLILIPTIASGYDLAVLNKMLEIIKEASVINDKLKVLIFINRASPNPFLKEKIKNLKEYLNEKDIPDNVKIAETIIFERESYRNAVYDGLSVIELKEKNKAKEEIETFYSEILEYCKN